jgi:hypothetical protein
VENYFCGHCGNALLHQNQLPVEPLAGSGAAPGSVIQTQPAYSWQQLEPVESQPPPTPALVAPEQESAGTAGIGGDSILGVADSGDPEAEPFSYLYEPEPRHPFARILIALVVLAALAGLLYYKWEQLPGWYAMLTKRQNAQAASQPQTPSVASPATQAPLGANTTQNQPPVAATPAPSNVLPSETSGPLNSVAEPTASGSVSQSAAAKAPIREGQGAIATSAPAAGESTRAEAQPSEPGPSGDGASLPQKASAKVMTPANSRQEHARETNVPRNTGEDLATKGQAYLYGNGVERDCGQALVYLRKAADMGNAQARSQLGALYATGHCVPLDRARAYNWFSLALRASSGHSIWVERNRQMLWDQMTESEKARALGAQ